MAEKIILDRTFDSTVEEIQSLVDKFFFDNIRAPLDMEMTIEMDRGKQAWVIPPEERGEGFDEKLINGWVEINPMSIDNETPVNLKIVSSREELIPLWIDLKNFIEASILAPNLPPSILSPPIRKQLLFGEPTAPPTGRRKDKRGRPTKDDKVKLDALLKWDSLDKSKYILEDFLEGEFGTTGGNLNVAPSTFHGWRKEMRGKGFYKS